jgi:hypothetical protein
MLLESVNTIHLDQGSLQQRILVNALRKCRDEGMIDPKELFFFSYRRRVTAKL